MSRARPIRGRSSSSTSSLFAFTFICIVASILLDSTSAQRVDCRKFVFAPTCRGVAAKRATLEVVPRRDSSEEPEGVSKILGLSESSSPEVSSSDDEMLDEDRTEEEDDDEEQEDGDEEEEEEKKYETSKRPTGRRGGHSFGRRIKDKHFGRIRKSGSSMNFLSSRKVSHVPSTLDWFSSEKRKRRNKGLRRHSEYRNYDY